MTASHLWRPLPSGDLRCDRCFRVEERNGHDKRGASTTYRGGIGYTARLRYFPGACLGGFDRAKRSEA